MTRNFRKLPIHDRVAAIGEEAGLSEDQRRSVFTEENLDLANVMVESAFGTFPEPLGLVAEALVDGRSYRVPMATEEPSVIAAAGFACRVIAKNGGFSTEADDPVMTTQLLVEGAAEEAPSRLTARRNEVETQVRPFLASMGKRGGGFRDLETRWINVAGHGRLLVVELHVDVRDAMGANVLNTAAEHIRPLVAEITGGTTLMAILTNAGRRRTVRTSFRLPLAQLARGGLDGEEVARRLEIAAGFADADENRAVTHNKGIMNGITAVTLATGNDTRAVEAAAHAYASRSGRYRSLSAFTRDGSDLVGSLELPLALGTVGGAVSFHPAAQAALRILGNPHAQELARVVASVGLAQNLAAVWALVTEGIQQGHMRLHARRVAWKAGARGSQIDHLAAILQRDGIFRTDEAQALLRSTVRGEPHGE
ncbi:MAG: hydroxymethylglutaryl-CoA reductase, degradative [Spirochaetes bacterium]|jgi:hydroxymethylglutaryl-CoA reductase|nr:hydroxymethylglutaryl-CoA reductase, degradative [Spirochaetota bacterium]